MSFGIQLAPRHVAPTPTAPSRPPPSSSLPLAELHRLKNRMHSEGVRCQQKGAPRCVQLPCCSVSQVQSRIAVRSRMPKVKLLLALACPKVNCTASLDRPHTEHGTGSFQHPPLARTYFREVPPPVTVDLYKTQKQNDIILKFQKGVMY